MAYCCAHDRAAARLFSRLARRYRKRFSRRGFERLQRQMLDALEAESVEGARLLEIGSGVGALHQYLLERGAALAVGVDLSPAMIEEARAWADERGLAERVDYRVGDFLAFADELGPADVTILDKVVCCHPQGPELVDRALEHTTRLLALSCPRHHVAPAERAHGPGPLRFPCLSPRPGGHCRHLPPARFRAGTGRPHPAVAVAGLGAEMKTAPPRRGRCCVANVVEGQKPACTVATVLVASRSPPKTT